MVNNFGKHSITVAGNSDVIEKLIDQLDGRGDVLLQESNAHESRLHSSVIESIVLSATSGAGAVAVRSIVLALISKKRIKVSIETAMGKVDYEGPVTEMVQLARLADDLKNFKPPAGSK